jgi:DNA-binding MarR family transcriptional regulator
MAEMTAQEAAERGKTLNFEKVWAMFAEIGQKHAKIDELIEKIGQRQAKTNEHLDRLEKMLTW